MNSRSIAAQSVRVRRRRWPRMLGIFFALVVVCALVLAHFLNPARLTALILARASSSMQLQLRTSAPGSFALRPEPRLILPGLTATVPGERTPFFSCGQVELALPWSTLRGRGTGISSIVLKSPDLDLQAMQRWRATQPPSTVPVKLPTLTHGLHVYDGTLRGANWKVSSLDLGLPSLADSARTQIDASGKLSHNGIVSGFALTMHSTPSGAGLGLRVDGAHLLLKADGELPSMTADGKLLASDKFDLAFQGSLQSMPLKWSAMSDSSFAQAGDTPFSIAVNASPPAIDTGHAAATAPQDLRLHFALGNPDRQPALDLDVQLTGGAQLDTTIKGQLSRWPNAWPSLPATLTTNAAPIQFNANYQGLAASNVPIAFAVKRGDALSQGTASLAEMRVWIAKKLMSPLLPFGATFKAPKS